jgi:hypothetical protein
LKKTITKNCRLPFRHQSVNDVGRVLATISAWRWRGLFHYSIS